MPRASVKSLEPLEYLSILAEDGAVDEKLAPGIDDDLLLKMYRTMVKTRLFDERLLNLQRQGKVGTFAPVKGQEAAQIGSIAAIGDDDWFVPSFRESAAAIWRGTAMEDLFLFTAGYNEGQAIAKGHKNLPNCVPVASQLPHAVGIAYAAQLRDEADVVLVYFGDGATSEGDFHEALNFAGVFGLPVIFLCQNNQWAISMPREKQTHAPTLAQKAVAYGIPGVQVDGNDLLAVYKASCDAVKRARKDHVPTMIECLTYRMEVHTTADDPTRYRKDEDLEDWAKRDPIKRVRKYLEGRDLLDDNQVSKMEEEIHDNIENAWQQAQNAMEGFDSPDVIFDHMFKNPTQPLREQREQFAGRGR